MMGRSKTLHAMASINWTLAAHLFTATIISGVVPTRVAVGQERQRPLQANIILEGQVVRRGDNIRQIEGELPTVVVRVNAVSRAPRELGDLTNKEITVLLGAGDVRLGQRIVIAAATWLVAENIAVREIERGDTIRGMAGMRQRADQLDQQVVDSVLFMRLKDAQSVLQGRVVSVDSALRTSIETEHDPEWRYATVAVTQSLKGPAPARVRVAFPASRDIMWFNVPKLVQGQEAVFVLHQDNRTRSLTISDVADVQPAASANRLRGLIAR